MIGNGFWEEHKIPGLFGPVASYAECHPAQRTHLISHSRRNSFDIYYFLATAVQTVSFTVPAQTALSPQYLSCPSGFDAAAIGCHSLHSTCWLYGDKFVRVNSSTYYVPIYFNSTNNNATFTLLCAKNISFPCYTGSTCILGSVLAGSQSVIQASNASSLSLTPPNSTLDVESTRMTVTGSTPRFAHRFQIRLIFCVKETSFCCLLRLS